MNSASDKLSLALSCPSKRASLEKRLLQKIDRRGADECWPWLTPTRHKFGYGHIRAGRGFHLKAHRVAYALRFGAPPSGLMVCHECDNPACCNPKHLFLGTQTENMGDCSRKGRISNPPVHMGRDHHNTKFDDEVALAIARDRRPAHVIAAERGVSTKTIYRLRRGETWKGLNREA